MRRFLILIIVAVVAAFGVLPASAQSELDRARAQLNEAQARIDSLQADADDATDRFHTAQSRLGQIEIELEELGVEVAAIEADVAVLAESLADVAISQYTGVAAEGDLEALSRDDLNDSARVEFLVDYATGTGADVLDEYRAATAELDIKQAALDDAEQRQRDTVDELAGAQEEVYVALEEMQAEYDRVATVVANLEEEERIRLAEEARLAAEALAAAQAATSTVPSPADTAAPDPSEPADPADPDDPAPPTTAPAPEPTTAPPPPPPPPSSGFVCPVAGPVSFTDTFGAPRSGGRSHAGVDMMAATGTPVVNPVSGYVELRGNSLGGLSFYLNGDNGNFYYGAHLNSYGSSGTLPAGTVVGTVGSTGNATTPHLHFEIHIGGRGNVINPTSTVAAAC